MPRSFLYVPADQEKLLSKALDRGADALILDLEDGVRAEGKAGARESARAWLASVQDTSSEIWIRVNPEAVAADLAATGLRGVTGIVVPAAEPDSLRAVDIVLTEQEQTDGLSAGSLPVIALIETARGILDVRTVASAPRVAALALGRADLAAELRWTVDPDGFEFRSLLMELVIVSAAARIAPPIAPVALDARGADMVAQTRAFAALGLRSRTAIHPAQIEPIHEGFAPADEELAQAIEVARAWREASSAGRGTALDSSGRLVDLAVMRGAVDVLRRAGEGRHDVDVASLGGD